MITITLTADTMEELRTAAIKALGIGVPDLPSKVVFPPDPPEVKMHKSLKELAKDRTARRDARKAEEARGVVAVEEEGPEPEADFVVSVPGLDPEPEYVEVPVPSGDATAEAVALEKLKAETMVLIQDMFAAGKVKHIRAVLDKHGGGAKSFPEIEAKEFPVISAALKAA
jgi:hypothetical protein